MNVEQKMTVSEFKSWLRGICDILGEDWVPNAQQWKRIREKIDCLQECSSVVYTQKPMQTQTVTVVNDQPQGQQLHQAQAAPTPVRPAGPSSLNSPPSPPQSRVVSSPGGVPVLVGPMATNNTLNNPVKTPSIDTTNGRYDSPFI